MSYSDQFETALNTPMTLKQVLYVRYFTGTLVDLVVLGVLNQYWGRVYIESFSVALLSALLLQVLLQLSIILEHKAAAYFKSRPGPWSRIMRLGSSWFILFISKLIILWAIDVSFGDSFLLYGAFHGLFPFLVLVILILVAEMMVRKMFYLLGNREAENA